MTDRIQSCSTHFVTKVLILQQSVELSVICKTVKFQLYVFTWYFVVAECNL